MEEGRKRTQLYSSLASLDREVSEQSPHPDLSSRPDMPGFLLSWMRYLLSKPQCEKSPWGTRRSRSSPWIPVCTLRTAVHFQPSIWLGCRAGKQGSSWRSRHLTSEPVAVGSPLSVTDTNDPCCPCWRLLQEPSSLLTAAPRVLY